MSLFPVDTPSREEHQIRALDSDETRIEALTGRLLGQSPKDRLILSPSTCLREAEAASLRRGQEDEERLIDRSAPCFHKLGMRFKVWCAHDKTCAERGEGRQVN